MAGFESKTESILADLYYDRASTLGLADQEALATWATIVCMLRATQDPGRSMLAEKDFKALRGNNSPPTGFEVWLVHGEDRQDVGMRHYRATVGEEPGWFGWIWFGASVLVVSSPRVAPLTAKRLRLLPEAAARIYPNEAVIHWPPRNHVGYESLFDVMTLQR